MSVKPILCPKCRSADVYLIEHIVCFGEWSPGDTEANNDPGEYFKVTGKCSRCEKQWTLKNQVQMTDELKARLRLNLEYAEKEKKMSYDLIPKSSIGFCEHCNESVAALWRKGEPFCFRCKKVMPLLSVKLTDQERCNACSKGTGFCAQGTECPYARYDKKENERNGKS